MSILTDSEIIEEVAKSGMIYPFVDHAVKIVDGKKVIGFGLSSNGYDIRASNEWKKVCDDAILDPLNPRESSWYSFTCNEPVRLEVDEFILTRSVERFKMPEDVTAIATGKSTLARSGIAVNITPLEPCFADGTEILTPQGWIDLKNIKVGDKVLGQDSNGFSVWQPVEAKQEYSYHGELLHFDCKSIELLVTPEHNIYTRVRNPLRVGLEKWKLRRADNVWGKYNHEMTRDVRWEGKDIPDTIEIKSDSKKSIDYTVNTNSFLFFLGVYLGDGSATCCKNRPGDYIIRLAAIKERKVTLYKKVLEDIGVCPNRQKLGYTFCSKSFYNMLKPLGHAHEKYIPEWVKELPPHRLQYVIDGLMNSDGNMETGMYSTCSKRLADDVQEIMFKAGYSAIIRKRIIDAKDHFIKGRPIVSKHDSFIIRLIKEKKTPKLNQQSFKKVSYDGMVYDVTVPNHLIFVRYNGKPVWSGNCWSGFLTVEIFNTGQVPVLIYPNMGIAQLVFHRLSRRPLVTYSDKGGVYQNQVGVTISR